MTLSDFSQWNSNKKIRIKSDVVAATLDKYLSRTTHRHSCKLMFCNYSHKYNAYMMFHKDMP